MSINLKPMEELKIDGKVFVVQSDPDPDMAYRPYVELGGSGQVVQLLVANANHYHALKVFNNPGKSLLKNTKILKKNNIHQLPGLFAAERTVINPNEDMHKELIKKHPYLEYSVLMPWIGGYTWFEILGGKNDKSMISNFNKETSFYFGSQLAHVLASLEAKGYAHCDICSNNIILDFKNYVVQLIDIEDMYVPGIEMSKDFIGGQDGYAHPNRPLGHQWVRESDRFGGGILISEILTWHDPKIREASDAESYYSPSELCDDSKKYDLMMKVLRQEGSDELANLFDRVWNSKKMDDCPALSEWELQINLLNKNVRGAKPALAGLSKLGADGRIRIRRKRVSVTGKAEDAKPIVSATRKKVDITATPKRKSLTPAHSSTSLPTFQPKTDWGTVVGWLLLLALIIVICIIISTATAGYFFIDTLPSSSGILSPEYIAPVVLIATNTPRFMPTQSVIIRPTRTPKVSDLAGYSCPDKSQIRLRVGDRAIVPHYDVNLRLSPKVPNDWDANIVIMLRRYDKMIVIGGPKCAHEGTWWEVQTDNGYTGWVRELQPDKILLEPIK